jgi:HAD hydrolase, family IA, variant 1
LIKACIFDLDGTLLYTVPALMISMNLTLNQLGFEGIDEEHVKAFVGNGSDKYVERSLIFAGDKELKYYERACKLYQENFKTNALSGIRPYEGIEDLINELNKRDVKACVLSNKPQARVEDNIYAFFGKTDFFKLYGERKGVPIKPDPTALNMLMGEIGVDANEVLYIGDSDVDVYTARAAGAKAVAVKWGYRSEEVLKKAKPDHIIESPEEILRIVDEG